MNVTPNVVKDLLTVYLAGEAHADTRELVEEWLRDNPDVAQQVERARRTTLPAVAVPPPTGEKQALDRARRRWRIRWIVLGTAIYFSTLAPLRDVQPLGIPGAADRQLARTYRDPPRRGGAVGNLRGAGTSLAVTRAVGAWLTHFGHSYRRHWASQVSSAFGSGQQAPAASESRPARYSGRPAVRGDLYFFVILKSPLRTS